MATITSLSFVITSSYDGAGMRRARRDIDGMNSSTRSLHSVLTPFNDSLRATSTLALGLGPALIPAAAGAAALGGGLIAAAAGAGAAAGIFGGALFGAIQDVHAATKGAQKQLKKQEDSLAGLTPGTKAYAEQLKKVHEAERNLNEILKGLDPVMLRYFKSEQKIKSAWSDFITATQKDTLTPTSIAMDAVSRNMGKFIPIVKAVSPLVTRLAKDFARWMDGPGLDRFVATIVKYGVPALAAFIRAGKSVITVLGQGFRDFLPLGVKIVKALASGADQLKGWASGGGFEHFIDKVTDNAPALKDIFKSLVVILGNVAGSMDDTSDASLTIVGILTDLLTLLSPELITAITYAWLGWNLALEAYALYCTGAAVASVILATATSPFLLLIAGAALTVLAVVAALAALAVGIYFLVKYWDQISAFFVKVWDATWNWIKNTALKVWDFLTHGWGQFVLLLLGPIGLLVFIATHWKEIWSGIQIAAEVVWDALKVAWAATIGWLSGAWDTVLSALLTAWHAFASPFITAWNAVWAGLVTAWNAAIAPIVKAWNTVWPEMRLSAQNIWNALSTAWSFLWSNVTAAWNTFWAFFSAVFSLAWQGMSQRATAAWSVLTAAWSALWAVFAPVFTTAWQSLTVIAQAVWAVLTAAWNLVWTVMVGAYRVGWAILSGAWNVGWSVLTGMAKTAWAILTGAWSVVWTTVNSIWNVFYAAWSAVFSGAWKVIVAIATGVWNVIKAAWSALWAVVTAIFLTFTAIFTGHWGKAWNAIKDAAQAVWNVLLTAWRSFLNVVTTALQAFIGVIKAAWSAFWSAVQAIASAAFAAFRGALQAFLSAVQAAWSTAWTAVRNVFQTVLNAIQAIASAAWSLFRTGLSSFLTAVQALWTAVWTAIRTLFQAAVNAISAAASAFWSSIRAAFSAGSTWLRTTFWDPVHNLFTKTIPNAFTAGAKALGAAWSTIKKLVRDPIQAVVNVVYNNGIVKLWNAVAGVFGAKKLDKFALPAFKEGGPTGSGSASGFTALVHPGEHVWTKDEVRGAGGHGAVAALRSEAMGGAKVRSLGGDHAFKDGGGILGSGIGPDSGPDLVPDGIIKDVGKGISSAVGKLKDLALGAISGPFGAAVDAVAKVGKSAVRAVVPGSDLPLEQLGVGMVDQIAETVKSWVSDHDTAPDVGGNGFSPWAKWKDGDGTHVNYGGVTVNRRTAAMLNNAAKLAKTTLSMFQGSYSRSVGASAGTHDGGGAADVGPAKDSIVGAMRASGFAAWRRTPAEGFSPHVHGIAVGDPTVSSAAAAQIKAFNAGRNGLANNGPDTYSGGGTSGKSVSAAKATGKSMNAARGWSSHWSALEALWTRESGWRWNADNPSSDAYGIPQALPGSKMKSSGADWKTNPATQIKWGLGYIASRYGNPSKANSFQKSHNWYGLGTPGASRGPAIVGEHEPEFMNLRGGERIDPLSDLIGRGGGDIHVDVNIPISGRADHGVVDRLERETIPKLTMAIKQGVGRRP